MKLPILSGDPAEDLKAFYSALFPKFSTPAIVLTGVTGASASCLITRMGRFCHVQAVISGTTTSVSGLFNLSVSPFQTSVLQVFRMTVRPTILGLAGVSKDGIVLLPDWAGVTDDVLISGILVEV